MFIQLPATPNPTALYTETPSDYEVLINIDNIVCVMEYGDGKEDITLVQLSNQEDFYIALNFKQVCHLIQEYSKEG
jgi:hypothetical protein